MDATHGIELVGKQIPVATLCGPSRMQDERLEMTRPDVHKGGPGDANATACVLPLPWSLVLYPVVQTGPAQVLTAFGEVKPYACAHQDSCEPEPPRCVIAERQDRDRGADERGGRKIRTGAC